MANDPILPQPDVLNEVPYGKFVLTNLAAKRAKQIKEGAPPLVRINSNHPLSIALAEIAAGKIKPVLGDDHDTQLVEQISTLDEFDRGSFLLPGLDDEELAVDEIEGDEEDEVIEASPASRLTDLLGDDDIEEVVAEDEEISLDDLAKQEEDEEEQGEDV